jgi:hypothetical protein
MGVPLGDEMGVPLGDEMGVPLTPDTLYESVSSSVALKSPVVDRPYLWKIRKNTMILKLDLERSRTIEQRQKEFASLTAFFLWGQAPTPPIDRTRTRVKPTGRISRAKAGSRKRNNGKRG